MSVGGKDVSGCKFLLMWKENKVIPFLSCNVWNLVTVIWFWLQIKCLNHLHVLVMAVELSDTFLFCIDRVVYSISVMPGDCSNQ